jgi:hypothetical protein
MNVLFYIPATGEINDRFHGVVEMIGLKANFPTSFADPTATGLLSLSCWPATKEILLS